MRLIDADLLMEQMEKLLDHHLMLGNFSADDAVSDCIEFLKTSPTIDAVPVVRCKDCRYWGDEDGFLVADDGKTFGRCTIHNYMIDGVHTGWCPKEDCFCSIGERKDEVSE